MGEMIKFEWQDYAAVACLGVNLLLFLLLGLKFRTKLSVALVLIGIMVLLWSAEIILMSCEFKQPCYILIGFIILEDILTIIFCSLTRRFKKGVAIALLCITVACFAVALYTINVGRLGPISTVLAGGILNTAVDLVS
uniref:Uncharacterized protein n=1 Tax=Trichobilharzia regenti TaxID=157069 RepID=A0AA85J3I8_TRIRE|nr:unnamed protein product [Trichobilharzia regenti]